ARTPAGHLARPPEAALGLPAGPFGVELVGEVREHEPPRARPAAALAGLLGGQVPAPAVALPAREPPPALALRARQRGLDQQQRGVAREVRRLVVGAAVRAEGQPRGAVPDL